MSNDIKPDPVIEILKNRDKRRKPWMDTHVYGAQQELDSIDADTAARIREAVIEEAAKRVEHLARYQEDTYYGAPCISEDKDGWLLNREQVLKAIRGEEVV